MAMQSRKSPSPQRNFSMRITLETLEPRLPLSATGLVDVGAQPDGALAGKIVYTHGGHGITADNTGSDNWFFQRGVTNNMIEDLGNQDQMSFFVDYLFRAGATIVPLRPVGHQPAEVVLDNDDTEVTFTGNWADSGASVYFGDVGDVPSLIAATSPTETAYARYRPNIPKTGFYPVYAWTEHGADRASDQLYRIHHSGGTTEVTINHRRVGSGPVYLGTYYLEAGNGSYVDISNRSGDGGKVVVADMIRFGNGVGDIDRGGGISGLNREDEAGLYWIQWHVDRSQGIAETEYRVANGDLAASRPAVPMYSEYMNREADGLLSDRVQVSFHSNAGAGVARGVLGLFNGNNDPTTATPNQELLAQTLAQEVNDDMVAQDGQFEHFWQDRTVVTLDRADIEFSEINNQSTGGEFDATIIETAFHDNFLDAQLMRDPNVRDALARATYQGLVKYFHAVDGGATPTIMAPAAVSGVRAESAGSGSVTISWLPPATGNASGDPATGYRVYGSTNGYGFDGGTYVSGGSSTSTTFTGLDAQEGAYYFKVVAVNAGGESPGSEVVATIPGSGPETSSKDILIVNGFDRLERAQNPLQTTPIGVVERVRPRQSNSRDYAVQVAAAIERLSTDLVVDTAANEAIQSGDISLSDYRAVLWIAGEESAADDTFDLVEQAHVTAYLAEGGKLFVSGSDLGWDLDLLNNGRPFYNNWLHADYLSDDAGTYRVNGVAGSIFDGLNFSFDDGSQFYDTEAADVILPVTGAITALEYDTGGGAAIQFDGGQDGTQVVMLAFPFETITDMALRTTVLERALTYFGFDVTPIPYDLILDNGDDISIYFETGSWSTSSGTGYDGTSYRFAPVGSNARARWTFSTPAGGQREVFVQYRAGSNRASSAAYEVDTGQGIETVTIDQSVNNLEWVSLGTFDFTAGSHTVLVDALASTGGSIVIADAVRIRVFPSLEPTADFDTDGDIDGGDFLSWQRGFGIDSGASRLDGDSNGDGMVDSVDLQNWQFQFGNLETSASAAEVLAPLVVNDQEAVPANAEMASLAFLAGPASGSITRVPFSTAPYSTLS